MHVELGVGLATAVGSLPHLDPHAAAELSLRRHPSLPAIPSLPSRSPWESMLGQAAAGLPGVTLTDRGLELVDGGPGPDDIPITDLQHDAFGGMRAFLDLAAGRTEPVKWQVTGPVTLGLALLHAGLPAPTAFERAQLATCARITALGAEVSAALPGVGQVVIVDEPSLTGLAHPGFPVSPREAMDLLSAALGAADCFAVAGVHCCGSTDWGLVDQAGAAIMSMPADHGAVRCSGALADFLARGGRIAWGAIPTDGPRGDGVDRHWRALAAVWCELVRAGCDPVRLRTQAIVTPECGLAPHTIEQADHVLGLTQDLADRVLDQAVATRFSLGA
ncbi:MAG TPA: hypothetical protein VMK16_06105 [Acidimicrobiales bacterium]|nr:hypothetical protein [Acidimicrobiales bacterium]